MAEETAFPGKKIGVIEEYLPGVGTYTGVNGFIRAKVVGKIKKDSKSRQVKVLKEERVATLEEGDEVVGTVATVSGVYGNVKIEVANEKLLRTPQKGIVYPSRVIRRRGGQYRQGDIVFAAIVSKKNRTLHLTIDDVRYGVVKATCNFCGYEMTPVRRGRSTMLRCPGCGEQEQRKVSDLYSKIV